MYLAMIDTVRIHITDESGLAGTGLDRYIEAELFKPAGMHTTNDGLADVMHVAVMDLGKDEKMQAVTVMINVLRLQMIPGNGNPALVPIWMKSEYIETPRKASQRAVRGWLKGLFMAFSEDRHKANKLLDQAVETLKTQKE